MLYPVGVLIKPNYDSIADYVIRLALCMLTPPLAVTSVNQLFRDVKTFILLRQMCDQLVLRRWQQVHQYFSIKVHIVFSILNLQSLSVTIVIKQPFIITISSNVRIVHCTIYLKLIRYVICTTRQLKTKQLLFVISPKRFNRKGSREKSPVLIDEF